MDADWLTTVANHKQRQAMQIGRAAANLALREGLASVTMSGLAREAGVSRATLYNYVPDVATAIRHYLRVQQETFAVHVSSAVAEASGAEDKLRRYIAEQVAYVASPDHRVAAALMDAGIRPESETSAHSGGTPTLLRDILVDGSEAGDFTSRTNPETQAVLISRLLYSAHELVVVRNVPEATVRDAITSMVLDGIQH